MSLDHNSGRPLNHTIPPIGNAITSAGHASPQTTIVRHRRSYNEGSEADRGALATEGPFWPGRCATALLILAVVGSFVVERPANLIPVADKDTDMVASFSRMKQDDQDETARPTGGSVVASIAPVPTIQGENLAASESVAPLPSGHVYGAENNNSRITLRIHRPTRVIVSGRRGQFLLQRSLQRGDTYSAPNLPDLTITTEDAGAVEVMFDGQSVGFVGSDGAMAQVPLRRFAPAAPRNEEDNRRMALEAFERAMSAKEAAKRSDEARATAPSAP
jgi:hypothetical protein